MEGEDNKSTEEPARSARTSRSSRELGTLQRTPSLRRSVTLNVGPREGRGGDEEGSVHSKEGGTSKAPKR